MRCVCLCSALMCVCMIVHICDVVCKLRQQLQVLFDTLLYTGHNKVSHTRAHLFGAYFKGTVGAGARGGLKESEVKLETVNNSQGKSVVEREKGGAREKKRT